MTTALAGNGGPRILEGERDEEGHRTYMVTHIVRGAAGSDGPAEVMQCAGLPAIGDTWSMLNGNDVDVWAWCTPYMKVTIHQAREGDPVEYWAVQQKFTTKPMKRCNTAQIEDPLSEPQKVSGSFVKYTKEVYKDRFGRWIRSSSHEQIRGPQVEFDSNRPTVRIEQNVLSLGLSTFSQMVDTVNDSTLWGLPRRCIKLSNVSWERKLYGVCTYYYTRSFDFDIDYNTFDRTVPDEGTKCLNGRWATEDEISSGITGWVLVDVDGSPPDKTNPLHFVRYKDRNGENARVMLDGNGLPADTDVATNVSGSGTTTNDSGPAATIGIEYYPESNFLTLGIPTSF